MQEAAAHAAEDRGYRTLLSPQTERDLPPADRRALLLEVYEAYLTNPLAHAVIEVGTNFVLGRWGAGCRRGPSCPTDH